LRVISTPIRDVVSPYGDLGLAEIVSDARDFISVAKRLLASPQDSGFEEQADLFLAGSSWDRTWAEMDALIEGAYQRSRKPDAEPEAVAAQSIA
jgi:UDP-galactopyranose mutase